MEEFLDDFLMKIDQMDSQLHAARAEVTARLTALRLAGDPVGLKRVHELERQAIDNPPRLDDPNFLVKRLAEYQQL